MSLACDAEAFQIEVRAFTLKRERYREPSRPACVKAEVTKTPAVLADQGTELLWPPTCLCPIPQRAVRGQRRRNLRPRWNLSDRAMAGWRDWTDKGRIGRRARGRRVLRFAPLAISGPLGASIDRQRNNTHRMRTKFGSASLTD